MTDPMDPIFSDGLRASLVSQVELGPRRFRPKRWQWGVGAMLAVALLGGGTAFASQLWVQPGGDAHSQLAPLVEVSEVGTATIRLGERPKDATEAYLQFFPLDAGTYGLGRGGASVIVSDSAVTRSSDDSARSARNARSSSSFTTATYYLQASKLDADGTSLTVTTSNPNMRWSASVTWVSSHTTPWGMNAAGKTYGMQNDRGTPDLIAVTATNGEDGYVYRSDLDNADGTTAAKSFHSPQDALDWQKKHLDQMRYIPVYTSDGTTRIGRFCVGTRC